MAVAKEYTWDYFKKVKSGLKLAKLGLLMLERRKSIPQLHQELDLDPPLLGFLDQNQIEQGCKRELGALQFEYAKLPKTLVHRTDIITLGEIRMGNLALIRQCTM